MFKKILKLLTILENPSLFKTIGTNLNRGFIKELLILKNKFNIHPTTIIDVGAACGEWTFAANFVFPTAKIYSFEPIKDSYLKLKERANFKKEIETFNYALYSSNQIKEFYLNEFVYSSSLLKMKLKHKAIFPFTEKEKVINVQCRRFDSLEDIKLRKDIYLKIDVQGTELEVLNGFGKLINEVGCAQVEIIFESLYENQSDYLDIFNFFSNNGFKSFYQFEPYIDKNFQLIYCDLIFLK